MKRLNRLASLMAMVGMVCGLLLHAGATMALDSNSWGQQLESSEPGKYVMAYDKIDVEDHSTYSSEYLFGLTKGVVRSTLEPALKPVVCIVTVPLDIALLPFAAIAGFFR